jgi:hypothetical protein
MLWSHILKIRNYNILLKVQVYKKLDIRTTGYESRVPNTSLHCTFLDYDNVTAVGTDTIESERRLREELEFLQEEFEIGNFYVFETRNNGRHAVCLDALRFMDVKNIIDFSSCDIKFKSAPRINEYRCWVLRYEKKGNRPEPKYLYTVESAFEGINPQSLGHATFLLRFGLHIPLKKPIGTDDIGIQEYNTTDRHTKEPEIEEI